MQRLPLLLVLAAPAAATIISDGGWRCIFNANGVQASSAQRNMSTPALAAAYNVRRPGPAALRAARSAARSPRPHRSRRARPAGKPFEGLRPHAPHARRPARPPQAERGGLGRSTN